MLDFLSDHRGMVVVVVVVLVLAAAAVGAKVMADRTADSATEDRAAEVERAPARAPRRTTSWPSTPG